MISNDERLLSERARPALEASREFGFFGPGPVDVHLEHALGFLAALRIVRTAPFTDIASVGETHDRFVDLGAGGGLPGLVLACVLPYSQWLFLDSNQRRMGVLGEFVQELDLADRVAIYTARAEDAGRDPALRGTYSVVMARGFAGPSVTAECAAPLLAVGGLLIVSEPPDPVDRWDPEGLAQVGLTGGRTVDVGHRFFAATQSEIVSERFPRRVGIPEKRPLFR
jgi:16S rRNA (guanine527-N7)-methyltransferase